MQLYNRPDQLKFNVFVFIMKFAHEFDISVSTHEKIHNCQQKDTKKEREDGHKFGKIDLKCMFCPRCPEKNLHYKSEGSS